MNFQFQTRKNSQNDFKFASKMTSFEALLAVLWIDLRVFDHPFLLAKHPRACIAE